VPVRRRMENMVTGQLRIEILKHTQEDGGLKKLSCHRAHVLAEDLAVPLADIGRICNDEGVRIMNCELGCFGDGSIGETLAPMQGPCHQ